MTPKFTPGPWTVSPGPQMSDVDGEWDTLLVCADHEQSIVAEVCGEHGNKSDAARAKADARLIASAPDYHTAVEALLVAYDESPLLSFDDAIEALRAVHKKATNG